MTNDTRVETDSLGELEVPAGAYYGIQTLRASRNFPISGLRSDPAMIDAMMLIKKAAAQTNVSLGFLSEETADAVIQACDEVLAGKWRDQFIVDVFQMGAGTSLHMNCNEVLANRASEILGGKLGEYSLVHPNDDVNKGQSTNDVFPAAMSISVLRLLGGSLEERLAALADAFARKGEEFHGIVKSGRTHLQDAPPVRLGREFQAYSRTLEKAREAVSRAADPLGELGIGGSAVGTGLNTCRDYPKTVVEYLSRLTGFDLSPSPDLQESMQSMHGFAGVSAALRNLALELNRIANDLRLLASGPRTGFSEILLPAVAPGSSIMPGKVNPSMLEMLNMVCFQVIGCDGAVSGAVQAGQLELNVMMPVIAFNLHFMIRILGNALREVREHCIEGITADPVRCRDHAHHSLGIAAALSPHLGYTKASEIAKQAIAEGKSLIEVLAEQGLFSREELENLLDPERLTEPGPCRSDKKKKERD